MKNFAKTSQALQNQKTQSIQEEVEKRFERDFNFIHLPLLEKAYPHGELLNGIIYPDNYDFEHETEPLYPCWNTLFEAREQYLSDLLKEKVNELAEIGIYLMEVKETRAMMFIQGCSYSFYDHHWVPLYRDVLRWVR